MKMKTKTRNHGWYLLWGVLALVNFCFLSCKDDDKSEEQQPFDPTKPVLISDFTPKEGGMGTRLVVYGDNFGNDVSRVKVTIGGKAANLIGVKNQSLHCFVPSQAFNGDIEVTILDENGEEIAYAEAEEKFAYQKKMLVTTLAGETYENNTKWDVKDGPFDDCGGFDNANWMVLDPIDSDKLYVCGANKSHRVLDLANKTVGTISFPSPVGTSSINAISFSKKGELIVVKDYAKTDQPATFFFSRESGFQTIVESFVARGSRSASVHPINGEVYTSRYDLGVIGRYDQDTKVHEFDKIPIPYSKVPIFTAIHPSGEYMYLILSGNNDDDAVNIIMRSDYNWEERTFTTPYLVCGKYKAKDWADGMGNRARLNRPREGCFVKNPEYAGQNDEYDFYFCDQINNCIRKMTPEGRVSTFAGRPNGDGKSGYNDGDLRHEARFARPTSIVYDEKRECFYVGDVDNHRIRKIAMEE